VSRRSSAARHRGRVSAFDDGAGYGTITDPEGEWFFHCTAIADGTRRIEVDADVAFVLAPGHLGRWEARDVGPA
jgi:cold shock CspA family protein